MYFVYFCLLVLMPICLVCVLNSNNKNLKEELLYMKKVICQIIKVLICIYFIVLCSSWDANEGEIFLIFLRIAYFTILAILIIFLNYFSTNYNEFRKCIKLFLDKFIIFSKENFIFNLLFVLLIVFINKYNDLAVGLIGAYFFFALTSIHSEYKKEKQQCEYKKIYKTLQTMLNLSLLAHFTIIERMISSFSVGKTAIITYEDSIYSLCLFLLIVVNYFVSKKEMSF